MVWLRKVLILTHRYLGIALSLLFLMWFVSGIAMLFAGGMPRLTPAERLERMPALDLGRVRLTPAEAAMRSGLQRGGGRLTLLPVMGRPVYRFAGGRGGGDGVTVFADTGDLLDEIGEAESIEIARRFMKAPPSALHHVAVLNSADQWTIEHRSQMPLHKITVDDAARTELYVSEETAEVALMTTRGSRALAGVAAIPHWLYFKSLRLNDGLWTRVVLWTSGLGTVSAFVGLILGVTQIRTRYVGWMRWHYVTGAIFGVFTLTWVSSGFLSMEPWDWTSRGTSGARIPQALGGGPASLSWFPRIDPAAWNAALSGRGVKEVEFLGVQGKPYYALRGVERGTVLMAVEPLKIRRESFSLDSLVQRIKQGNRDVAIANVEMLSRYDSYYYDRDREAPLPILRVKFADRADTWFYIDPRMSQVVSRLTRGERVERWLYHGFHSLDFSFWYYTPLWTIGVIVLCSGGAVLSFTGVVIGFKRLQRILNATTKTRRHEETI